MTEGTELRLSDSAISTWLSCGLQYLYRYVYRIKGPPTLDMAVGRAVHGAIEAHWHGQPATEALGALFEAEVALVPDVDPEARARAVLDAQRALGAYLAHIAPTFTPSLVEARFRIKVDGVLVDGVIDAADEDVHDTKTTSTPSKVKPERHRTQLGLYKFGFKALTGRWPRRLLLDVVGRNGRFKIIEVEPDDQGMADVVGLVADGIKAGKFEPTGALSGACSWCSYRNLCSYSTAKDVDASAIISPSVDLAFVPD